MSSHVQKVPPLTQIMNFMDNRPEYQDLFGFNETFQSVQFLKDYEDIKKGTILRDDHVVAIRWHLTKEENSHINTTELEQAIQNQAFKHKINPVRNYLDGLKWDGDFRLDTWLSKYAGVVQNEYIKEIGRICLLAAVGRVYEPGVKYDNLLVIEGEQGAGKSRFVEALGGEWFLDMAVKESDKDIVDEMRGAWIIEISELAGFSKKEVDWLKAFLSRRTDRCRLSYGRRSQDFPRQSIFIGTMNPSGDNTYLKDDTGNRRFWPITAGEIDVEGLKKARNQLFAEAVYEWKKGGVNLFLQGTPLEMAENEQTQRNMVDPWSYAVRRGTIGFTEIMMPELMNMVGLRTEFHGIAETMRLGRIMKNLGWIKKQKHTGERYYIRKEDLYADKKTSEGPGEVGQPGRSEYIGEENSGGTGELAKSEIFTLAEEMPDFNE
jgi:putative DNA primase/helicase